MENSCIYGKNAVIEALSSSNREFNRILISNTARSDEKIEKIKELAKKQGIVFQFVGKEKLNQLAPEVKHQGVIAQVAPIKYVDLDDFIEKHHSELTSVVILDGVEDSHNLGAIIRSCVCAGVKGIILPSRRGVLINSTVEKTSAGAVNHISIIKVNSIVNAVQRLKEKNYWVIAADHHSQDNYYDVDAIFCSYKKVDDRIYLYVTVEDKSAFDSSESNNEELRLELVGDNCDVLGECLANNEMREGDKLAVKCSTWIYMDSTFYYIAEIKGGEKTFLSFDDGLKNIIKYIGNNKSLF